MSNVVEEKWGKMGENGGGMGEFLHILLQNGGALNDKGMTMLVLFLLLYMQALYLG